MRQKEGLDQHGCFGDLHMLPIFFLLQHRLCAERLTFFEAVEGSVRFQRVVTVVSICVYVCDGVCLNQEFRCPGLPFTTLHVVLFSKNERSYPLL